MPSNILCLQPCAKGFLLICPRLDAGTFGTMGVGTGFAIAAALLAESQADGSNPPRRVVCVQGDSAFGFSGMELETACR